MAIQREQAERIASVLSEGLPYIQKFNEKIIVIKYGGAAMTERLLKKGFARDIALMKLVGMRPVIVHGGGPQIAKELKKKGIISKFSSGNRKTDKKTMMVVKRVLGRQINSEIVSLINSYGARAKGLNYTNSSIIQAIKLSSKVDLGYVGKVRRIKLTELKQTIRNEQIPVISPIGYGKDDLLYNINADLVAAKVAQSLKAEKLILLTDIEGVVNDKKKLMTNISLNEATKILKSGIVKGGMVPKLTSAIEAKSNGVGTSHIIDGRIPNAVLLEVLTEDGVGTLIN